MFVQVCKLVGLENTTFVWPEGLTVTANFRCVLHYGSRLS